MTGYIHARDCERRRGPARNPEPDAEERRRGEDKIFFGVTRAASGVSARTCIPFDGWQTCASEPYRHPITFGSRGDDYLCSESARSGQ